MQVVDRQRLTKRSATDSNFRVGAVRIPAVAPLAG